MSIQCEYEKKEGIWLPVFAHYTCGPSRSVIIETEWIAVNNPVPRGVFVPAAVSGMTGLKTTDGGAEDGGVLVREILGRAND